MKFLAIFKPERHEPKPLPTETWADFLILCKAYLDENMENGRFESCGSTPGGDYISGFAVIHAKSPAEAWYILKAFPGYEIVAKYDLIPIVDFEDYYNIELAKETRRLELQEEKQP